MHEQESDKIKGLPDAAFRELNEGEEYSPVLSPYKTYRESTFYSIGLGLLFGVIFTVAASYMPLKVGQGVTSDVPIAAIAIGLAAVLGRKNALAENAMMEMVGSTGSMVNSGAIFIMPAFFILNLSVNYSQFIWTTIFGGFLGIFYAIILREYFVVHMHGKYPFPGSLATTEILMSGAGGGNTLKLVLTSAIIGGVADFLTNTFAWWHAVFTSRFCSWGEFVAKKYKLLFSMDIEAAVLAIGYMTGLRYALIIASGSFFGWFCLIPLINYFADGQTIIVGSAATKLIKDMSPEEIFRNYVRYVGIGTLAMSGIIGVIKMGKYIGIAFRDAIVGLFAKKESNKNVLRTKLDLPMPIVVIGIFVVAVLFLFIIQTWYTQTFYQALLLTAVMLVGSFLFSVVGTTSIAYTASEPVSGLTLLTLVLGAEVMIHSGLIGAAGITAVLLMCTVVCSCLFMTGCFVGDLKVVYWLGVTPKKVQVWKMLSVFVSAIVTGGVIIVLAKSYGFSGEGSLVAPQANAMASVIDPLMSGQEAPWALYFAGAMLAIFLDFCKVPALAFGLGLYIPLQLNTPLLVGGLISHYVSTRSKDAAINKARFHRGVLISSGFIAGGSLMGVLSACLVVAGYNFAELPWAQTANPEMWSLLVYALLVGYYIWDAMRVEKV